MKGKHKPRMLENRVLGRIFRHEKEEASEGQQNCILGEGGGGLHDLYTSPDTTTVIK